MKNGILIAIILFSQSVFSDDCVDSLLNTHINTRLQNVLDEYGSQSLHFAVYTGDIELLKAILINTNIDANTKNNNGLTPLHSAVLNKNLEAMKVLLDQPNVDINATNKNGSTPLHSAIIWKHTNAAKMLIDHSNIDINIENESYYTYLHLATYEQNVEVLEMLLQHPDIDVNIQNKYGISPLHVAVHTENIVLVKMLFDHPNINLNIQDKNGQTPFDSHIKREDSIIAPVTDIAIIFLEDTRFHIDIKESPKTHHTDEKFNISINDVENLSYYSLYEDIIFLQSIFKTMANIKKRLVYKLISQLDNTFVDDHDVYKYRDYFSFELRDVIHRSATLSYKNFRDIEIMLKHISEKLLKIHKVSTNYKGFDNNHTNYNHNDTISLENNLSHTEINSLISDLNNKVDKALTSFENIQQDIESNGKNFYLVHKSNGTLIFQFTQNNIPAKENLSTNDIIFLLKDFNHKLSTMEKLATLIEEIP